LNLLLMRIIDEEYTKAPMYGSPKITQRLRQRGHPVNHKRVERLMALMGLRALTPKRRLTRRRRNTKNTRIY
jgi:putative transposase